MMQPIKPPNELLKVGYVAVVGMPNAGKSTLINLLFGQKLAIVSPKAQTTRFALRTIYNDDDCQIIFMDTPGIIHKKSYLMHTKMSEQLDKATDTADAFIIMLDILEDNTATLDTLQQWTQKGKPYILLLNKADTAKKRVIEEKIATLQALHFEHIIPFVAQRASEKEKLLTAIKAILPMAPPYYEDREQLSDKSVRFFCAELIREQLFFHLHQELPYEATAIVYQYEQKDNVTVIYAHIIVSKESQKIIVIGEQGKTINAIGRKARQSIEKFIDTNVYLDLRVKVRKDWKKKTAFLKEYGFGDF